MRLFLDCLHLETKIYQKNHFPHFLSRSGLGIQEKVEIFMTVWDRSAMNVWVVPVRRIPA